MADWRARGYVADSDDEDDSQEFESSELSHPTSPQNCVEQYNAPHGSQPQRRILSPPVSTGEREHARGYNAQHSERQSLVSPGTKGGEKNNRTDHANTRDELDGQTVGVDDGRSTPSSPLSWPDEPNGQTVGVDDGRSTPNSPLSWPDDGEIDELQWDHYRASPLSNANLKSDNNPLPAQEQHNSSPSMPRSSLTRTVPSNPAPQGDYRPPAKAGSGLHKTPSRSELQGSYISRKHENQTVHSSRNFKVIVEVPAVTDHQQSPRAGRSLRHRNPIQLHPYAIESEKYRQILKARGVKPLRIVQTQNQSEAGHGEDSQTLEHDMEEEAQEFELSQNLRGSRSRSSSPFSITLNSHAARYVIRSEIEGDEFPDVDAMLRAHHQGVAMNGFKRRKTAHTFSKKMHRPLQRESSFSGKIPMPPEALDLFDTPVSPPPSSESRRPEARSKMPKFKVPPGLSPIAPPTPVTSSEPRKLLPVNISDDEQSSTRSNHTVEDEQSEQPQLSDDSVTESQPPSPIQQAQRQIRGVLPASWLSLDRKTQKAKSNKKPGFQRVLSGGGNESLRGVARRKTSHKSASLSTHRHHPIVLSDDENSDSQSDGSAIAMKTKVATAQTTPDPWEPNFGDDPMSTFFGEVEEDNRIDEIIPTQRKKSTGTRQRRMKGHAKSVTRAVDKHQLHSKSSISHRKVYQPRITQQFKEGRKKQPAFRPPRLSILDAYSPAMSFPASVPPFLKVALRTARFRKDKGRQSPTKKYLRLATIKDTEDVDKALGDWRNGRVQPRTSTGSKQSRKALTDLTGTNQILAPPMHNGPKAVPATVASKDKCRAPVAAKPRKLQQTLDQLVARSTISQGHEPKVRKYKFVPSQRQSKTIAYPGHVVSSIGPSGRIRPAALEGLQSDQERQRTSFQQGLSKIIELSNARPKQQRQSLPRKRAPRHLTPEENGSFTDAATIAGDVNHHPDISSKPAIQTFSSRRYSDVAEVDHIYPIHATARADATGNIVGFDQINVDSTTFDIQPLPSGTRLGSNTFVGSGDFQRYTRVENFMDIDQPRGVQTFRLRNGTFDLGYVISHCYFLRLVSMSILKTLRVIILMPLM